MLIKLYTKWSLVGAKISALAEILVPCQVLLEFSATLPEVYALESPSGADVVADNADDADDD